MKTIKGMKKLAKSIKDLRGAMYTKEKTQKAYKKLLREIIATTCFLLISINAYASINLDTIAHLESSNGNNKNAYNLKYHDAIGKYQIASVTLKEYNNFNNTKLTRNDLLQNNTCAIVAEWYINKRIPQMLNYYKIPDTTKNRLIAYNWGIGNLLQWHKKSGQDKDLPKETYNYIIKYYYFNN